jgi:hypothetical protein
MCLVEDSLSPGLWLARNSATVCYNATSIQLGRCYSERGSESEETVEDRLKELMQELGNAINESLSDSDRIAGAIGEIKRAGYDVFLVLEATIGFNKREDSGDSASDDSEMQVETESPAVPRFDSTGKVKWTSQDHKFLRALKISVDEETR